jgi:hypothetical protein
MSAREKGKCEDMTKMNKTCYEREMKPKFLLKGKQQILRIHMHPGGFLQVVPWFVLSITSKSKDNIQTYPLMM